MVPEITYLAPCAIYESSSLSQFAQQPPASQGFGLSFPVPHGFLYSARFRKPKRCFSHVWNIFWFCCFGLSCSLAVVFYSLWRVTFCISFSSSASFLFGPINLQPLLCTKSIIFKCSKYTYYCFWNKMWAIVQNTQLTPKCLNRNLQDISSHVSMAFFSYLRLLVSSVNDT